MRIRAVKPTFLWRRGRDSNPCGVAPKRFSRPPRYDRFDTSPCVNSNLGNSRNHLSFWLVSFAFLSLSLSDIRYYISSVSECQPLFWIFFTFFSISFSFSLFFPVLQFTHLFLSIYSLLSVFCFFLFFCQKALCNEQILRCCDFYIFIADRKSTRLNSSHSH